MRKAAISTGPETHLDHLAPICALMQMPLFLSEEEQVLLAQTFYPSIEVAHVPLTELQLDFLKEYRAIFHCGKFWTLELRPLLHFLHGRSPCFVLCPHGNSDKETTLTQVAPQDIALVYGNQMRSLLKGNLIETGNLRYIYYLNNRQHFDSLAKQRVFSRMDPCKKIILYAPTWNTRASPTSFFQSTENLIQALSDEYSLLIKLHPLLCETHPAHYWYMLEKYNQNPSVFFLECFPAIYPLLEKTAIYIGDYSSIGYDFLLYDRPMFFLHQGLNAFLHNCGKVIALKEIKEELESSQEELSEMRRRTYAHAFSTNVDPDRLHSEILKNLQLF